ncbi:MAG TPA: rRNA (cytidine-2'-O-)-methyltransferase, partial [Gammaproteobacteria bacterium]|nr:rRNA (cytidine-2'-O-)-methyltransferase [Gammaproteobacteria bacterium]
MSGTLYVVATPIGHLGDLSQRSIATLKQVQIVAAEDTRRTGVLLAHIGHDGCELVSLHDHNEDVVSPKLITRLQAGDSVALVSDAGTPLINDPGFR